MHTGAHQAALGQVRNLEFYGLPGYRFRVSCHLSALAFWSTLSYLETHASGETDTWLNIHKLLEACFDFHSHHPLFMGHLKNLLISIR